MEEYGPQRVVQSEINGKKTDLAFILSKESLLRKDIFLLNLVRSAKEVSYGFLENVKDGFMVSPKYNAKKIYIKTPNTVIVFSNTFPETSELSKDRWKIFEIKDDDLHSIGSSKRKMTTDFSSSSKKPRVDEMEEEAYQDFYDKHGRYPDESEPDTK